MTKLKEGQRAPGFELTAHNGRAVSLANFLGNKNVVLYFYPKDDTPGCTIEACGLRDARSEIFKYDTTILGISPDNMSLHQKFAAKFGLTFLLLSDEDKSVCKKYGVWVEKNMYGRKYMGVARTTFIIAKDGRIVKIFENVKPKGHEQEVLAVVKEMAEHQVVGAAG